MYYKCSINTNWIIEIDIQRNTNIYLCIDVSCSFSSNREPWRWCVLCQSDAMIWWTWAGFKASRWETELILNLSSQIKHIRSYLCFTVFVTPTHFQGKITAQGKLLQQDTFSVSEQEGGFLSRARERRVFLFEQLVIFSEPIDKKKGFLLPGYIFKNSIKVRLILFCFHLHFELLFSQWLIWLLPVCPAGQLSGCGEALWRGSMLPGSDLPGDWRQHHTFHYAGIIIRNTASLAQWCDPDLRESEKLP